MNEFGSGVENENGLPCREGLCAWLGLESGMESRFDEALLSPLDGFLGNRGKGFRGELVELSHDLVADTTGTDRVNRGKQLLEHLHAGSLVVDDIEDGSELRRGKPTLHRSHGVPLALNAGNWLYFWPLERVRDWGLSAAEERDVYRLVHRCLSRAHFGQALDVGVSMLAVEESEIEPLCLASLQLKTGALTALSTGLGALLAGAGPERLGTLEAFGREFGVALQMLDDIGNATGWRQAPGDPKRFEDLRLGRPSWLWAVARRCGELNGLRNAVSAFPDTASVVAWLEQTSVVEEGRREAAERVGRALEKLEREFAGRSALARIGELARRLVDSYR